MGQRLDGKDCELEATGRGGALPKTWDHRRKGRGGCEGGCRRGVGERTD